MKLLTLKKYIGGVSLLIIGFFIPTSLNAVSIVVYVPEKYSTVEAGERLYFQLEVLYPENMKRQDLRISYQIKDGDAVVTSSSFLKAIETQASFMDYVVIPETVKPGLHLIDIKVESVDGYLSQDVSASFQVSSEWNWFTVHFYIILATILGVGIVLFFEIRMYRPRN